MSNNNSPKWLNDFENFVGDTEESKSVRGENFAEMFEESMSTKQSTEEGRMYRGTIVAFNNEYATIDIGSKSEGFVPIAEFKSHDGILTANVGDVVDVFLIKVETDGNFVRLSKNKADYIKAWDKIKHACDNNELIEGIVVGKIKGGLNVDIMGVKAFIPASQIDARPTKNLDVFIGKKYNFKVEKFSRKRGNVVLTRKELAETELAAKKAVALGKINEGDVVKGTVKSLMDYGAFVDIGGIDGLLHVSDISWKKIKHPSEAIKVGQEINVKVVKFEKEKEKISLSHKATLANPWDSVAKKYPVGAKVKGKVVSIKEYGAFVLIEDGVEGLIHVSEMSWVQKVKSASKMMNVGDVVEAQILSVDLENKKISLGLKQLTQNPWDVLLQKYQKGAIVEGTVKNVADFGVFVDINEGIDGMIHVNDISWAKKGSGSPTEKYKKGDKVKAVVLNVDKANEKFSLGVKQLEEDPWKVAASRFPIGAVVEGKVTKVVDFGAFVELQENVEGLIYISELSEQRVEKIADAVKLGDMVRAEVVSFDEKDRKIGLSVKQLKKREEREMIESYSSAETKTSFGDIFGDKLKNIKIKKD